MSVKRYAMTYVPHDTGAWVKYDDHAAEVERLTAERDEARAALREEAEYADGLAARVDALEVSEA